ncbi:MAG TPA: hypothetical protein VIE40_04725 [Dehalococcoidia bacterium]
MIRSRSVLGLAVFAVGALALMACGSSNKTSSTPTSAAPAASSSPAAATPAAASDASIKIVQPAGGWTFANGELDVQVAVKGLTMDGTKIGQPAAQNPGVGHWHVYVDGTYAGLSVSDVVAIPNDAMPQISAGMHEIKVQLHHTDHTPLTPEVTDTAMINFPTALSYAPASGGPSIDFAGAPTVDGKRVVVHVAVAGLTLDGTKIGQPAAQTPGVGHWHVYVDGTYAGLSVSNVISLPNDAMPTIAPGPHEIKVQLHHTDHTPLTPEQSKTMMFTFP